MKRIDGQPILTAAEMRAAEERAIAAGASIELLMERAGAAVAEEVRRLASGAEVLVLCGPGNNGGDGYVAARVLKANGVEVRVAATGEPKTEAAMAARRAWNSPVESLEDARPAPILVDALFGTGLSRRIEDAVADHLWRLRLQARFFVAVDVPSGLDTDSGELLTPQIANYDLTLALGAVKPAHVLTYAGEICGEVRVIDLQIDVGDLGDEAIVIERPALDAPGSGSTKYNRGMVAVIGGVMPGAAALASEAAMRAGAGYVLLLADEAPAGIPHALVRKPWSTDALGDERIGALVIGPGLGRDDSARDRLTAALRSKHALVIDGDALRLLDGRTFHDREAPTILTPHGGEFKAVFGEWSGSKIDAARRAAKACGATVVFKGSDTVIADPAGKAVVSPNGSPWLSTAGTGDVLAGTVGAMATSARPAWWWEGTDVTEMDRAQVAAAVWMHAEAARRLGGAFIADDLARELTAVRAAL